MCGAVKAEQRPKPNQRGQQQEKVRENEEPARTTWAQVGAIRLVGQQDQHRTSGGALTRLDVKLLSALSPLGTINIYTKSQGISIQ